MKAFIFPPALTDHVTCRDAQDPEIYDVQVGLYGSTDIIDERTPQVSWKYSTPFGSTATPWVEIEMQSDRVQRAVVASDGARLKWPFRRLRSGEYGSLRLRALMADGRSGPWSPAAHFQVGLSSSDWTARFVTPATLGTMEDGAPVVFKDIELGEVPERAFIWVSAHGLFDLRINGSRVTDDVLAPGWTAYQHRLRYHGYEVSRHLRTGRNRLEITLGNGWYRGQLVWKGNRSSYGTRLSAVAQLDVVLSGGKTARFVTDETWSARASHVVSDDLYDGESQDFRLLHSSVVDAVEVVEADFDRLVTRKGPSVKITEVVKARSSHHSPSGKRIIDFGQNLVGWVQVTLPPGGVGERTISIRHAEVLENDELAIEPLRSAKATCTYIVTPQQTGTIEPSFTFSGFRYVEITGADDLDLSAFSAAVVGSALRRIGTFECSDPRLNALHANVVWGARGNFLDLPTDCPQRDERLGWTGDIQVFAPTANYLFDTSGFLSGWLEDLASEQAADGSVPFVIPDVLREGSRLSAGWGDAAVVVPYSLYWAYGDDAVLRRQYASMQAWIDRVEQLLQPSGVWMSEGQFGDWLDPTAPPENASASQADQSVVATAYFARSCRMMAETATALRKFEDATHYGALAEHVTRGFASEFIGADGRIVSDCQTVYALGLAFDLIPDASRRTLAGSRLRELVESADHTVGTGFLGTPHLLDALYIAGHHETAYSVLLQTRAPSWLYAVENGATTIWERWDALLPDGTVNTPVMTSFNHYAYGAVADWMHRHIGGLRPLTPGYGRFAVEPTPTGRIDHAHASLDTPHGLIDVRWTIVDDLFQLELVVPPMTTAEVRLPHSSTPLIVGAGDHSFTADVVVSDA